MSKMDSFRFSALHKRRVFVVLAVIVVLILMATSILFMVGAFSDRSKLVRVNLSKDTIDNSIDGFGVNLDYIPTVNRIRDASFEKEFLYDSYVVAGSDSTTIYINPTDVTNIKTGSTIKVYSIDSDEKLSCVYESVVNNFDSLCFGQTLEINNSLISSSDATIVKTVVYNNNVIALLDDGRIVFDLFSDNIIEVEGVPANVIDIAICNGVYALSDNGDFYFSNDGQNFGLMATNSEEGYAPVELITSSEAVAALCEDGKCLVLNGASVTPREFLTGTNVIASANNSEISLHVTEGNKIYITTNFVLLKELMDLTLNESDIIDVVTSNESFYLIHADGTISVLTINDDGVDIIELSSDTTCLSGGYVNAVAYRDGIIAVNSYNLAILITPENGSKTLSGDATTINNVYDSSSQKVLFTSGGKLYATQLLSGISTKDAVNAELINSGDVCCVGTYDSPIATNDIDSKDWSTSTSDTVWDIYGDDTIVSIEKISEKNQGSYCARLSGNNEGYHMISQVLLGTSEENFEDDTFYRMELKLKQEEVFSDIDVWLSIDGEIVEGFNIGNVGDKFANYSYVFVIPSSKINDKEIRFNIGFSGSGTLFIDNVYVGEDKYSQPSIKDDFASLISNASPNYVRLNNLNIGANGYSIDELYGNNNLSGSSIVGNNVVSGCSSLEQSLRLVRDAKSNPWLVISSNADADDINYLMEYLCGFNSSTYSEMRVNNGTSMPWSQQFDRIYLEINDVDGMLHNDQQRGAYVNYVISLVEQSDYYVDVRDKVYFIDGMVYDYETILSDADYHSMTLDINITSGDDTVTVKDQILEDYKEASYHVPRLTTHSSIEGELFSSVTITSDKELTAADLITALFNENSMYVNSSMINFVDSGYQIKKEKTILDLNNKIMSKVLGSLSSIGSARYCMFEIADPPSTSATDTAESFASNTTVTCIDNGDDKFIIVANNSTTAQQFIVDASGGLSVDNDYRYSASGNEVSSNRFGINNSRSVIQTGQYIIIKCN